MPFKSDLVTVLLVPVIFCTTDESFEPCTMAHKECSETDPESYQCYSSLAIVKVSFQKQRILSKILNKYCTKGILARAPFLLTNHATIFATSNCTLLETFGRNKRSSREKNATTLQPIMESTPKKTTSWLLCWLLSRLGRMLCRWKLER